MSHGKAAPVARRASVSHVGLRELSTGYPQAQVASSGFIRMWGDATGIDLPESGPSRLATIARPSPDGYLTNEKSEIPAAPQSAPAKLA
jgi:hypothetical protein